MNRRLHVSALLILATASACSSGEDEIRDIVVQECRSVSRGDDAKMEEFCGCVADVVVAAGVTDVDQAREWQNIPVSHPDTAIPYFQCMAKVE